MEWKTAAIRHICMVLQFQEIKLANKNERPDFDFKLKKDTNSRTVFYSRGTIQLE